MKAKKNYKKKILYLILSYFIIWIILFELLLPVNNILPKPSTVIESFPDLWTDYKLGINYLSTVSVIYVSLFLAYRLVKLLSPYLVGKEMAVSVFINSLEWFSEYVPGILIGLILIFWFPESEYTEFIFAFATAFSSLLIKFQNETENVNQEYILTARSVGLKENSISRLVIWNNIKPKIFLHFFELHFYVWSLLIAFEFIKGGLGIGLVFRQALEYKDISAVFSAFVITGLTIYIGTIVLKYMRNKFVFWK